MNKVRNAKGFYFNGTIYGVYKYKSFDTLFSVHHIYFNNIMIFCKDYNSRGYIKNYNIINKIDIQYFYTDYNYILIHNIKENKIDVKNCLLP